jgi:hypothetical protein
MTPLDTFMVKLILVSIGIALAWGIYEATNYNRRVRDSEKKEKHDGDC